MVFWSGFIKKIKNAVTKERVDKLEQKINTNATNIELIEQDVETNTNDISTIRNNITSINSNINDLDNDVARIENSLTNTNNELDSLEARVNGYDDRINEANTKATSAEEQATRLGLTVSSNTTKITALESKNIKVIEVAIEQFTEGYSTQFNPGRAQTYWYPISRLNLNKDRIISIKAYNVQDSRYFSFLHGPLITWTTDKYIVIWSAQYNTNTAFTIAGRVYVYYI